MTRATIYSSAAAIISALLCGGVDSHPIAFALCGITFAISAGLLLFKE